MGTGEKEGELQSLWKVNEKMLYKQKKKTEIIQYVVKHTGKGNE